VDVERFLKALPSLSNPYALAGYLVIAIIWFGYALSKARAYLAVVGSDLYRDPPDLQICIPAINCRLIICVGYAGYQAYLDATAMQRRIIPSTSKPRLLEHPEWQRQLRVVELRK